MQCGTVKNANLAQNAHAHVCVRTTVILHKRRKAEVVPRSLLQSKSECKACNKCTQCGKCNCGSKKSGKEKKVRKRKSSTSASNEENLLLTKKRQKLLQDEYNQRE